MRSVFSANFFENIVYKIPNATTNYGVVFEDKLKDMKNYIIKIALIDQEPRVIRSLHNRKHTVHASSVDIIVLGLFVMKFNARVKIIPYFNETTSSFAKKTNQMLSSGSIDLTINTIFSQSVRYPNDRFINTYDENAYCAIVPIPPRKTFLHYLLTPFDLQSWMFFMLCVVSCAALWHFLKEKMSAFHFIFAVAANFFGQSIPMSEKGKIPTLLFQLCVLLTFIMGNAYQSIIIASMSSSRDGSRLKSFDELMNSSFSVKADMVFLNILNRSGEFQHFLARTETGYLDGNPNYQQLSERNYAIIARCDMIESSMNAAKLVTISKYYYKIPEKVMPFYEQFRLSDLSPFHKVIQKYYNHLSQSGIRLHLFNYFMHINPEAHDKRIELSLINEDYLLGLHDVHGTFYIVLIGFILSTTVFIMEIFYHRFFVLKTDPNEQKRGRTITIKKIRKTRRVRRSQVEPKLSYEQNA